MKRIILVEDDAAIRDGLSVFFEMLGMDLAAFADGAAILRGDFPRADLFLIDKQLSGVDGLDLCRALKSAAATCQVPIIMMSASPAVVDLARSAGADAAIVKPYRLEELRALVLRFLA